MNLDGVTIGIPKEIMPGERRVAVIPDTVKKFVEAGAKLLLESGAGHRSFYDDEDYRRTGAEIVQDVKKLHEASDIIIKVKEPQYNDELQEHEIDLYPEKSVLVSFLHPANRDNHAMVEQLAERNVTSYTLDGIPRISRAQHMDTLTSMSTAAGYKAVIMAAGNLPSFVPMMPTSFGVLPPAQFLIVGAGVAGLQAIATAKRLGAKAKAVDIREEANEQASSVGAEVIPFEVPPDLAMAEGGYARRLPEDWYRKERELLAPHVQESEVVILTALIQGEEAPVLIDKEMVENMKKGSVIIDIAIDQGGNCALSRVGEEYSHDGVLISAIQNIPASLSVDSTSMFAQNVFNFINYIAAEGKINDDLNDEVIQGTLVTKDYKILHKGTLSAMGRD